MAFYVWGQSLRGGIGGLLQLTQGGNDYSYLFDTKGNVVSVLDNTATEVAQYRYNSFGKVVAQAGTLEQPFQFSTKRYDAGTGLNYYGYRFYSPGVERWMNRDPLGERGGINLYGFVQNDPVNFVDPEGLARVPLPRIRPNSKWNPKGRDPRTDMAKKFDKRFYDTVGDGIGLFLPFATPLGWAGRWATPAGVLLGAFVPDPLGDGTLTGNGIAPENCQ